MVPRWSHEKFCTWASVTTGKRAGMYDVVLGKLWEENMGIDIVGKFIWRDGIDIIDGLWRTVDWGVDIVDRLWKGVVGEVVSVGKLWIGVDWEVGIVGKLWERVAGVSLVIKFWRRVIWEVGTVGKVWRVDGEGGGGGGGRRGDGVAILGVGGWTSRLLDREDSWILGSRSWIEDSNGIIRGGRGGDSSRIKFAAQFLPELNSS